MRRLLSFLVAAVLLALACDREKSANDHPAPASAVYLSLGDSVAAGNGASDAASTSFPALVATDEDLALENLALAGATTADVIEKQLPKVANAAGGREVALITISAGGNDLAALIPNAACQQDPLPASCPLEEALAGVAGRIEAIVSRLRQAYPATPIVLLAYPNFFSGTGHAFEAPAARVLPRLGETIRDIAMQHGDVAVASPSFEGRGSELTHVLDERFDPHPNDAGHRLIAGAVTDAYHAIQREGARRR